MYKVERNDILTSRNIFTGKWEALHTPTGFRRSAYSEEAAIEELIEEAGISEYLEYSECVEQRKADFRESIKDVVVDREVIQTSRLSWLPVRDAWTAWHNGWRTYGSTEEDAVERLINTEGYLTCLKRKQSDNAV